MSVSPVGSPSGLPPVGPVGPATPQPENGSGFGDVVEGLLKDVNQQQTSADTNIQNLMTGDTSNVDDVVMSVVQADLAFRMVLEIRNRLISSYQEVMRMQV